MIVSHWPTTMIDPGPGKSFFDILSLTFVQSVFSRSWVRIDGRGRERERERTKECTLDVVNSYTGCW
jgi:hypothetical protein